MISPNMSIDTNGCFSNNTINELNHKCIVPTNFNPNSVFYKNITDKTNFIDIFPADFDSMFLSMEASTKNKITDDVRNNFFNLDENGKEKIIKLMIHLETGSPEDYIRVKNWHKIDGKWYYFKNKFTERNINELLGEVISEYFGLDTVHYKLARVYGNEKTEEGLISENFCDPNYIYRTCPYYKNKIPHFNDFNILRSLRNICPNDDVYKLLLSDIKKFIIRDFSVGQRDRNYHNFLFKENDDSIRLAPLYDYESSFDSENIWIYENFLLTINVFNIQTIEFLKNDSQFQNLLEMLMDMNVSELIKIVESRHNIVIEDNRISLYKNYTDSIKNLVKTQGLIK